MKKVLLLIISLFLAQSAFAYQTVLIDLPSGQGWHTDYYAVQGDEAILQYVPAGQTTKDWVRTVVFHSYKNSRYDTASKFMDVTTGQMESQNPSQAYKYLKYTETDSIATRCVTRNTYIPSQCEIYRIVTTYDGLISMHYIDKNKQRFKSTYNDWFQIIKGVRIYYSYYLDDRVMGKSTSFQL